jgi:hypothetical protein
MENKSITVIPQCVDDLCVVRMFTREKLLKLSSKPCSSVILSELGRVTTLDELRSNLLGWLDYVKSSGELTSTEDFITYYLGLDDSLEGLI